jgi:hypothetical protein
LVEPFALIISDESATVPSDVFDFTDGRQSNALAFPRPCNGDMHTVAAKTTADVTDHLPLYFTELDVIAYAAPEYSPIRRH